MTDSAHRFDVHMTDSDALLWNIEKDPALRSTITAMAVLDRSPAWDRLAQTVERATRAIPRLRQRVVVPPLRIGPPRWVVDAQFDLGYHLRRVRAPEPGGRRELLEVAQGVGSAAFDRARPLWEFVLVEGLADGGAALIQKVHHSITDGVGGIRLAMEILDLEADPTDARAEPPEPIADDVTLAGLVRESLGHARRRANGIARRAAASAFAAGFDAAQAPDRALAEGLRTVRSVARVLAPASEPLSPVMRGRGLAREFAVVDVGLDELKRAAKAVDGTLNDAFVAAVTGGLRRYHEAHGSAVDALRMTMPINIRGDDDPLAGNRFVPARFPVPVAIRDPGERMRQVGTLVRQWRDEPALSLTDTLAGVLNRLPTSVVTRLFGGMLKGVDFVTSNVPGVPFPVYLAGAEVTAQYAFGPTSGSAVNVVLVSHCGTCHLGVNIDAAAIPDPARFVEALRDGVEEVVAAGA
jgi:WS/DGAT/MGAT family acyltransferase